MLEDYYFENFVLKNHKFKCKDIRKLGKIPFCWIFKYNKINSIEEKEDKNIFENLNLFNVFSNGGENYTGFNVQYKNCNVIENYKNFISIN